MPADLVKFSTAPMSIGPDAYTKWRTSSLGAVTESLEQHLILDLMGPLNRTRVLDVGCGDGALVRAVASQGAVVTGLDPDPAMLQAARTQTVAASIEAAFVDGRAEQLPFPDASFDEVVTVTALCFIADTSLALREMVRVLRPGGRLVIGDLGRWSILAMDRRVRGWLGSKTWAAAKFRTASELRALTEQTGLRVVALRGAIFYPPIGFCARALSPIDPWLGRLTTFGAAFIALAAGRS